MKLDVRMATDFGPRLMHLAPAGEANLLFEDRTRIDGWNLYGGHRFWHAPEDLDLTYVPDNDPPAVHGDTWSGAVEPSGLQKHLTVRVDGARVTLTHRLQNHGPRSHRRACWGLTAMSGGEARLPRPAMRPHPDALLPDRSLVLWPYTDPADPRFTWGTRTIRLRQDGDPPQKLGAFNPLGWLAWQRGDTLVIKRSRVDGDAVYPDRGCTHELFTNGAMLELESLGPLVTLAPGDATTHVETLDVVRAPVELSDDALFRIVSTLD